MCYLKINRFKYILLVYIHELSVCNNLFQSKIEFGSKLEENWVKDTNKIDATYSCADIYILLIVSCTFMMQTSLIDDLIEWFIGNFIA